MLTIVIVLAILGLVYIIGFVIFNTGGSVPGNGEGDLIGSALLR